MTLSSLFFGPTVRFSAWKNSAPAVMYFREAPYRGFNKICPDNLDFFKNWTETTPNLPEDDVLFTLLPRIIMVTVEGDS